MFRSYLENNYFAYLLRLAYEDGFMTKSNTSGPRGGGHDFGRIAAMCAPEAMPREMRRSSVSPLLIEDDDKEDLIDRSLRKDLSKPILLESVIADAWTAGQHDRWSKSSFRPGCCIETLKEFVNNGPDPKEAKKAADRYAGSIADKYPDFIAGGNVQTKWGLTPAGAWDGTCVIGWYYGEHIHEGDYVEYAKGHVVIIGKIDKEARRAEALKLNYDGATLNPIMGHSISEHYSWWEEAVLRRGNGSKTPNIGQKYQTQSNDFYNEFKDITDKMNGKDKITDPKPIKSTEDRDEAWRKGIKDNQKVAESPLEPVEMDMGPIEIKENMKAEEEAGDGILMSDPSPEVVEAAKAAAAENKPAEEPKQHCDWKEPEAPAGTVTMTIQNNPSQTYTTTATNAPLTQGTATTFTFMDPCSKSQIMMQLHDKQVLSSKGLCEGLGLNYDEEIKRMREEGLGSLVSKPAENLRPAPKKKIKKPKSVKKVRARKKKRSK